MGSEITEINFPTYCTAFKALGEALSNRICFGLDRADDGYWGATMYREKKGDGLIAVPSRIGDQPNVWRTLGEEGMIMRREKSEWVPEREREIEPQAAAYFIAGAFGVDELINGQRVDETIVAGVKRMYELCTAIGDRCLLSDDVKEIRERYEMLKKEQADKESYPRRLAARKKSVEQLTMHLEHLIGGIRDQESLNAKLAPYYAEVPVLPETLDEYIRLEKILMRMMNIAYKQREEEKSRPKQ